MTPNYSEKSLVGEKAIFVSTETTSPWCRLVKKMPSARNFFITLFLGLLVTAGLANAVLKQQPVSSEDSTGSETDLTTLRDDSTFSRLLSSASPQALHEFLHAYFPSTYKHGVYDSDHSAMEAVHANDPELATSIVQMAKRQQSGNDTTTATSSTALDSSTVTSTSESSTTQESSTQEPTSTSPTSTADTTTTSTATPTPSTETESSTTSSTSESTQGTSSSVSDSTITSTSSASTTRPTRTSTFVSTLPGGAKTTITSVEVVTPGAPEEASTTSGSSGSLQSGLAVPVARKPAMQVVIGAVVGGALLA